MSDASAYRESRASAAPSRAALGARRPRILPAVARDPIRGRAAAGVERAGGGRDRRHGGFRQPGRGASYGGR
jgi:hypothetical protein